MSDFPVHGKEDFSNYGQAQETPHENPDNFFESLYK